MKTKYKTVWKVCIVTFLALLFPVLLVAQGMTLVELRDRAVRAGIAQERISELMERGEARGLSDQELSDILDPAVRLAEQNLPSEMIFQKAMEGIAKGIPAAAMDHVLDRIRSGTEQARPFIDEWVARPDVERMLARSPQQFDRETFRRDLLSVSSRASFDESGMDLIREILDGLSGEEVMQHATPSRVLAAVNIALDIPSAAQDPGRTREVITRAIQNDFTSGDLQRLPAALNMAQRRSQLPASAVMQGVGQQIDRGIPAAEILQNLFNGDVRGGGPPGQRPPGLENRPDRGEDHPGRGGRPVRPGENGPPGQGSNPPGQGNNPPGQGNNPPGQGQGR
ncbi:MAG: hypothetical protein WD315_01825 [Balneolaceae bacterium]